MSRKDTEAQSLNATATPLRRCDFESKFAAAASAQVASNKPVKVLVQGMVRQPGSHEVPADQRTKV